MGALDSDQVVAGLEIDPPRRIAVGRGSAFVLGGYCYRPGARTRRLWLELDGERQPVRRRGLPRADVFERAGEGRAQAFKSGFVAVARVAPVATPRRTELRLVLGLADGGEAAASLGEIELLPGLERPASPEPAFDGSGPRVAICMATYNPPAELLGRQLDSLRAQTHDNWICLISDDASEPEAFSRLEAEVGGDPRFVLSRGSGRLGFYSNFERALAMAPAAADFVTLCDQDDSWHPDKLERLLGAIGDAQLVYSDARVVSPAGELIQPTYWTERRNNHTNFGSLLLANSVTGAASLCRRDLLDDALPFPPAHGEPYHDHWLALVAMARGRVAYVEEPLYDYVQHGSAVIGHSQANRRPRPLRQHLLERLRNPGDGSRVVYYYPWQQQMLFAEVLRVRCWERMSGAKRRTLSRLLGADGGVAGVGWLLARRARRLWGRNETLDRELYYSYALARRRLVSALNLGRRRPGRLLPRDARIPPPGARR